MSICTVVANKLSLILQLVVSTTFVVVLERQVDIYHQILRRSNSLFEIDDIEHGQKCKLVGSNPLG